MPDLATNVLYYADNLDILRRYRNDGQFPRTERLRRTLESR
ncbi:MAG: hypothetical protein WD402_09350 [Chloroflexota bacterium]